MCRSYARKHTRTHTHTSAGSSGPVTRCPKCALPTARLEGDSVVNNPCTPESSPQGLSLSGAVCMCVCVCVCVCVRVCCVCACACAHMTVPFWVACYNSMHTNTHTHANTQALRWPTLTRTLHTLALLGRVYQPRPRGPSAGGCCLERCAVPTKPRHASPGTSSVSRECQVSIHSQGSFFSLGSSAL